jgi:hypothetical protein
MELATNPNVPKASAAAGRFAGAVAPIAGGLMEYGLPGALIGAAGAAKGAWLGGKTGWFTGKLAQTVSGHVAKIAEELTPYLQHLAPAVSAQGVLDLAQMSEPSRQDIGIMGIGSTPDAAKGLETAWTAMQASLKQGKTPSEAAHEASAGHPALYPSLMTVYGKSVRK